AIRQLLVQQLERRLADELCREEAGGLGRHFLGIVVKRALGKVGPQRRQQRVETLASDGGDDDAGGCWRLWRLVEVGGRREVGLRIDRDDRRPGRPVELCDLRQGGGRMLRERVQ